MVQKINKAKGLPQTSFTQGEISPALYGRLDFDGYYRGLKTCRNMIVSKYGSVDNRPGTHFVGEINDSNYLARLIPFQFNAEQQYVLELGNYSLRIIIDGAYVMDNGVPYLVTTPWPSSDISILKFTQSADIITIEHPDYPPYQIKRYGVTDWRIELYANVNGPFRDINSDETIFVYASAAIGSATVTASANIFKPDMVGLPFYIACSINDDTPAWEVAKARTQGDVVIYGMNYYQALNSSTTGTVPPTHTEGVKIDGVSGVKWQYLHSGFGIVLITGYVDGMNVNVAVQSRLPDSCVGAAPSSTVNISDIQNDVLCQVTTATPHGLVTDQVVTISGVNGMNGVNGQWKVTVIDTTNFILDYCHPTGTYSSGGTVGITAGASYPTYLWALPAWGSDQGWPGTTSYFQNRQLHARTNGQPTTVFMSRSNGFLDFGVSDPVLDDDAITYRLLSTQVNVIKHFLDLQYLLLLTTGGIWMVQGGSNGKEVLVPGTLDLKWQGEHGASDVRPLKINNFGLFVTELGNEVRSLGYSFAENAFVGQDITTMSHHLLNFNTIVDWTYQRDPYSCVWSVRDDGLLLGCTFFPEQQVNAWHWHDTLGDVESACCITENNQNVVYLIVKRTIGGTDKRYVERMAPRNFNDPVDAFFVDCGLTYDGRVPNLPASIFYGLEHLEGETVSILGDGIVFPQQIVQAGRITIDQDVLVCHIGLPYTSDFETLPLASMRSDIRDKQKLISVVSMIVDRSSGFEIGNDVDHLKPYKTRRTENYDYPDALISEMIDISTPATWDKSGSICVRQTKPLPLSILAVIPQVQMGS